MNWWWWFKNLVESNILEVVDSEEKGVSYWRNKLFSNIIVYLLPVSLIALVPGVIMSIIGGIPLLAIYDTVAVVSFGFIALWRGFTLFQRKIGLVFLLYVLSVILLFYLGSFGPGLLYLLALTTFISLIFPISISKWSIAINLLICVVYALLINFRFINFSVESLYSTGSWIAVSSNLIFLSAVIVASISLLFSGLQSTIDREVELKVRFALQSQELEKMLKAMEVKNEELEQFAFVASHDLQEPLRTISSVTEVLEREYKRTLEGKGLTYLDFLHQSSLRMQSMITALLEYSRIGKETAREVVDSNVLVQEVIEDLSASISGNNAKVMYSGLPAINAHVLELRQVFQNLISNAIKYRKPEVSPLIKITSREELDCYVFSVEDNGIGIEEKFKNKIFVIFQRLHPHSRYPGTGIGLAQCKKILELHGGKIWVESKINQGSTFYFTISKN